MVAAVDHPCRCGDREKKKKSGNGGYSTFDTRLRLGGVGRTEPPTQYGIEAAEPPSSVSRIS